jgi:Nucleotide modification associated domain 1
MDTQIYWNDHALQSAKSIFLEQHGYSYTNPQISTLRNILDVMINKWWMVSTARHSDSIIAGWAQLGTAAMQWAEDHGLVTGDRGAEASQLADLLCRKQHDYGHQNISRFGFDGLLVRVHDKVARLENLEETGRDPNNESVRDNIFDVIGYCCIGMMLERKVFLYDLKP